MNMRNVLALAGVVLIVGLVGGKANAAGEMNKVRGKSYVAACPPVKASIPRTPGPQRVMVIGAHPDDADIQCGCTTAKLIAKGARVKFVAVCNGNIGHHKLSRKETAETRRQETLNSTGTVQVWLSSKRKD